MSHSAGEMSLRPHVVVTVHNAAGALDRCLASVLAHTAIGVRIRVFDDASSDREVDRVLDRVVAARSDVEVHRNERRRGYVRTANLGLAAAFDDGAILLNSDTVVSTGWYEKLVAAAATDQTVATVTPVSNCAGPFSILGKGRCSPLPHDVTVAEMASVVEAVSPAQFPQTPTGHGYCMLVSPAALRSVGLFDESRFGLGYGEENDFCLRASAAGLVHLVEDSTFVFHEGGGSFGRWLKPLRQWRVYRNLRRLYPEYQQSLVEWLAEDPLALLRSRVAAELAARGKTFSRCRD